MDQITSVKERILARTPLDQLIGEYCKLISRGGRKVACCPFHGEKTPSFYIYDDHYHCFGCSAHGDAISFARHQQGLNFIESLRWLAEKYNIEAPELDRSKKDLKSWKSAARKNGILLMAQEFFVENLSSAQGKEAREYLINRGYSDQSIQSLGFGYAPDLSNALSQRLVKSGYSSQELEDASLISVYNNRTYDFFRHRLMIPIRDSQGRLVAFGGRALANQTQKYKNSRYDKGNLLFALDIAKKSMRQKSRAIVVEGYLDALKMHQFGFTETVACQGTALTLAHMQLLKNHTPTVYLLFDGDAAGKAAGLKTLENSLNIPEIDFKIATLPEGEDPDSFLSAQGSEAIEETLKSGVDLLPFAIKSKIESSHSTGIPSLISNEILPWLLKINDPIKKSFLIEKIAQYSQIPKEALQVQHKKNETTSHSTPQRKAPAEQFSNNEPYSELPPTEFDANAAAAPLSNLAFEWIGHLFFSTPESDEYTDFIVELERYTRSQLDLSAPWDFFAEELINCLKSNKIPAERDPHIWTAFQSSAVKKILLQLKSHSKAFETKDRKKIFLRLQLMDRQNKIKNTVTSIKDHLSKMNIESTESREEQRRWGKELISLHHELRLVHGKLQELHL